MKKFALVFLFAASLAAQVQIGKNVQIGGSVGNSTINVQQEVVLPSECGVGGVNCTVIYPTLINTTAGRASISPDTSGATVPGGGSAKVVYGPGCGGLSACSAVIVWSGYSAPAGVPIGNITAVKPFAIYSTDTPGFTASITSMTPAGSFTNSASSAVFNMGQTTGGTGLTGSQIATATMTWSLLTTVGGIPKSTLNIPAVGLIVEYTGTPVPANTNIQVVKPLGYNQATNELYLDPAALSYSLGITVGLLPPAAVYPGYAYMVTDSTSSSSCATGGGSNVVWCESNGTSWVAFGGVGGTPGGSTTQIQYNNAGAFGGDSGFTTDGAGHVTAKKYTANDGTGNAGLLALTQGTAGGTVPNSVGLQAPSSVTAYNVKLPGAQGTGALTNDGAGNLSWNASGGGASNPATCTANSTGNKCLGISPYVAVSGDWTTAIQQAITDLYADGGGTLWIPSGTYPANGALQDAGTAFTATTVSGSQTVTVSSTTGLAQGNPIYGSGIRAGTLITAVGSGNVTISAPATASASGVSMTAGGANAVITLPKVASGAGVPIVPITLQGFIPSSGYGYVGNSVITTTTNAGNFIGGYDVAGLYGGTIPINLYLRNLTLKSTSANPCIVMVNAESVLRSSLDVNTVESAYGGSASPVCERGAGIIMPRVANDVVQDAGKNVVTGFYIGVQHGEHTHISSLLMANNNYGLMLDNVLGAIGATSGGLASTDDYVWCQQCNHTLAAGTTQVNTNVTMLDSESVGTDDINDPNNSIRGKINGQNGLADMTVTGAINAIVCNIYTKDGCGGGSITGSGTTNTLAKFTASGAIGNSSITDSGTAVTIANPTTVNSGSNNLNFTMTSSSTSNTAMFLNNTSGSGFSWADLVNGTASGNPGSRCWLNVTTGVVAFCSTGVILQSDSGGVTGWASGSAAGTLIDTGLSRDSAGVVDVGNGAAGNKSGTMNAAHFSTGSNILYRCTTAGTLPVGALTTVTGNCGATADTGLRVN